MVGAVLTQNTAWTNVEKAIRNLVASNTLEPETLLNMEDARLADLLRPSGYFNVKAKRLKNFCRWYLDAGGYKALSRWPTPKLRKALLQVNGIGMETADDILLYAFHRAVFVVDAYTRRLFVRLGLIGGEETYEEIRLLVEDALKGNVSDFNEFHALIVLHGKDFCRARPVCERCIVKRRCSNRN